MADTYAPGSPVWWLGRRVANGDMRQPWYELTDEDRAALVAKPGSPPMPVDPLEEARERLEAAREAFLDLIANAKEWHEEGDEDGFHYTLRTTAHSLLPLMTAFRIEPLTYTEFVDGHSFPATETPAQAIYRVCDETPTITDDDAPILAELDRRSPPTREGAWVLVPREPTEAMLDQGVAVMEQPGKDSPWHVWAAMLAAAPPPPDVPGRFVATVEIAVETDDAAAARQKVEHFIDYAEVELGPECADYTVTIKEIARG